ncbi:hypothetical protein [Mycoplasma sp. 613B]
MKTNFFSLKNEVEKLTYLSSRFKLFFFTFIDSFIFILTLFLSIFYLIKINEASHKEVIIYIIVFCFIFSIFFLFAALRRVMIFGLLYFYYENRSNLICFALILLINLFSLRIGSVINGFKFIKNRKNLNFIESNLDFDKVIFIGEKGLELYFDDFFIIKSITLISDDKNYDLKAKIKDFCIEIERDKIYKYKDIEIVLANTQELFVDKIDIQKINNFKTLKFYILLCLLINSLYLNKNNYKKMVDKINLIDFVSEDAWISDQEIMKAKSQLILPSNLKENLYLKETKYLDNLWLMYRIIRLFISKE